MRKQSLLITSAAVLAVLIAGCTKQPTACFNTTETDVEVNATIWFTNCSENGVRYTWDFGDGNISEARNPKHTYAKSGSYEVKMTAYSENEKKFEEVGATITVKDVNEKFAGIYTMTASCDDTLYGGAYDLTVTADGATNLILDNFENEFTGVVATVVSGGQIDIPFQVVSVGDTTNWDLKNASGVLKEKSLSISYTLDDTNWDNAKGVIDCDAQGLRK